MALRPVLPAQGQARPPYAELNNLAAQKLGGRILFATDDWFAVADNLLKESDAEWREGEFTEFGKWMDGWETRRKRKPGHDWCIIKLGLPGLVVGVDVDTSYFTGNYSPRVSIQAAVLSAEEEALIPKRRSGMGSEASESEMAEVAKLESEKWETIIPRSEARPGYRDTCHTFLASARPASRYTHLRLNMFPDGGIARLRVFGSAVPNWSLVPPSKLVDLVAVGSGGVCLSYSDAHYGHPRNLINPWRGVNMGDGWETARRLDRPPVLREGAGGVLQVAGREWAVLKLGRPGTIRQVEVDTLHFKGNFPDSCWVDGCLIQRDEDLPDPATDGPRWTTILPPVKLRANTQHLYEAEVAEAGPVSHVRLVMAPDGGISRLRLFGTVAPEE